VLTAAATGDNNGLAVAGDGTSTFSAETDTAGGHAVTANGLLQTNIFIAQSDPDTIRPMIVHEWATTGTMNTDLIASVSRDGGTTWTAATMVDQGVFLGTQHYWTDEVDVSGQPAGDDVVIKMQGANGVISILYGNSMQVGI